MISVDTVLWSIGFVIVIFLGVLLIVCLIFAIAAIWIRANNAWRKILRAESLIYDYKRDFDLFQQWKKERLEALKDGSTAD